jgi:hypothetical protein
MSRGGLPSLGARARLLIEALAARVLRPGRDVRVPGRGRPPARRGRPAVPRNGRRAPLFPRVSRTAREEA